MTTVPIPPPQIPLLGDDGLMSRDWYNYFLSRDRMKVADLRDVVLTSISNSQVLLYSGSTAIWRNGAN